jgi:hypothetical protein
MITVHQIFLTLELVEEWLRDQFAVQAALSWGCDGAR